MMIGLATEVDFEAVTEIPQNTKRVSFSYWVLYTDITVTS